MRRSYTCLFPHCICFLALFNFQGSKMNASRSSPRIASSASPRFASQTAILFNKHFAFALNFAFAKFLVGTSGLEPPTSRLSGVRSNHLSYAPIWLLGVRSIFLYPMVEMRRIELLTPCVQGRCSPSWATPPFFQGLGSPFVSLFQVSEVSFRNLQNWTTAPLNTFFPADRRIWNLL